MPAFAFRNILHPVKHILSATKGVWIRLFVARTYRLILVPNHDIIPSHQGFFAAALDPQVKLYPVGGRLIPGWCLLSYTAKNSIVDSVFNPKIYALNTADHTDSARLTPGHYGEHRSTSIGQVFIQPDVHPAPEAHAIELHAHFPGEARHLFRYRFGADGFRFDPFDLDYPRTRAPNLGWFDIENLEITCLGLFPLLGFCLRHGFGAELGSAHKRSRRTAWALLRKKGGRRFLRWVTHRTYRQIQPPLSLNQWLNFLRSRGPDTKQLVARRDPQHQPFFTIVLCFDGAMAGGLDRCLQSITSQSYPHWELLVRQPAAISHPHHQKVRQRFNDSRIRYLGDQEADIGTLARGEYIGLIDACSRLEPYALEQYAQAIARHRPDILYADEAILGGIPERVIRLNLRPAFSYDYFLASAFTGLFTLVRTSLLNKDCNAWQYETADTISEALVLDALNRSGNVLHIPDVLHCRQATAGETTARRLAPEDIAQHLQQIGFTEATVKPSANPDVYRIRFHTRGSGKTAIVIPTKNQGQLLRQAIESIQKTVPADLYDIIVVDHESDEPESCAYLETLANRHTVLPYQGPFNFSRINNFAVKSLGGRYESILFLNNDIEATGTGWLESMRDKLLRPDVGMVGAILLYPQGWHEPDQPLADNDGLSTHPVVERHRIQHAGVILGIGNAEHFMKDEIYQDPYNTPATQQGNLPTLVTRGFSAVTAACLLTRRDIFEAAGGFDEDLAVGFGDVDLCLRTGNLGYKILCDGEAVLIHHESASRDRGKNRDPHPEDSTEFVYRYKYDIEHGDPFHHPLLSSTTWRYRPVRSPVRPISPVYRIVTDPKIRRSN